MKNLLRAFSSALFAVSLYGPAASADTSEPRASQRLPRNEEVNDAESTISRASEVYRAVIDNKSGKVPSSVLQNAKCVAVFPSVMTAALAVGGTHGDGVAFCRSSTGKNWSNPIFLDLTGASIGVQAGAKSQDLVLYFNNPNAQRALEDGKISLTGEFSVVAGSFDGHVAVPNKGVIAYTRTGGVFAGASLGAMNLSRDEDEQRAFYGKQTNSMFDGQIPSNVSRSVEELRGMLPA